MKNGFKLALLMAMLVALVASASATAPIIQSLPSVIVGSAGDISGTGTDALHLLRYNNAIDLAAKITLSPEQGTKGVRVMYTTTGDTLKVGKPEVIGAMDATEKDALVANGTVPADTKIMSNTALSLVYDVKGNVTNIATATPLANGSSTETITAANILGVGNKKTITLYAADDDVLTSAQVSAPKSFDVYAMLDANDGPAKDTVVSYDFEGGPDGWIYSTPTFAGYSKATKQQTATGIGFSALGTGAAFGSWASDAEAPIDASGMDQKIFEVIATLSGNAVDAHKAPGFRMLFASLAFGHQGGVVFSSPDSGKGSTMDNIPNTVSGNKEVRMYWAVPSDLTDYVDGTSHLDNKVVGTPGKDLRDYYLMVDMVKNDAADAGSVILENLVVSKLPRPADAATPVIKWGTGATAFNAAPTTWETAVGFGTDLGNGVATPSANNIRLAAGTDATSYAKANPSAFAGSSYPAISAANSNKLMRMHLNVQAAANLSPTLRVISLGYSDGATPSLIGQWGEVISPAMVATKYPKSEFGTLAGQPKSGGSNLDCYLWTNNFGTEAGSIQPLFDMYETGDMGGGWGRPTYVQLNSLSMEFPAEQPY